MGTEVGARYLADVDRYDQLPVVARLLGLDTSGERSLWARPGAGRAQPRGAALLRRGGGHHRRPPHRVARFLAHLAKEERAGRITPTDWSWIVPPISGSATAVFHRCYDDADLRPNHVRHRQARAPTASAPGE
jgi:nitric-oxide synthase, bacterial